MLRALLLLLPLVLVHPARATVIVPLDDAALARASDVAVLGVVTADGARRIGGRIVTETTLAVERVLRGTVGGASVTITTPGGDVDDAVAVVLGAPRFDVGEAVVVFLRRTPAGELQTTALPLGVYRLGLDADGTPLARRSAPFPETRTLDELALTAEGLLAPTPRSDDGAVATPPEVEAFTFLGSRPGRWFEADRGVPVRYLVANADPQLGAGTSNAVLDAAFAAWTNVPTASIVLQRGATTATGPSVAGGTCDGRSVVQFNDPNHELGALTACAGVLALGGFCAGTQTKVVNGVTFRNVDEGDLTLARGLGQCLDRLGFEEVATHEVGHTIGLGHSSENPSEPDPALRDATMYYLVHLDGRGASLRADDIAGVTAIYPLHADPNDLDGDGVPNADDACPNTPGNVVVDASGCACGEAGHVVCDDGRRCTDDGCDGATGRCTTTPHDCSDGDPCLVGACDEATGCSQTPATGEVAVACVYRRRFPPPECIGAHAPRRSGVLFRRAGRRVDRGLATGDPRRFDAAAGALDRAHRLTERAAARAHRPLAPACATAMLAAIDDARTRLTAVLP